MQVRIPLESGKLEKNPVAGLEKNSLGAKALATLGKCSLATDSLFVFALLMRE